MGSMCGRSIAHLVGAPRRFIFSPIAGVRPQNTGAGLPAGAQPNGHLVSATDAAATAAAAAGPDWGLPIDEGASGDLAAHDVDGRQKDLLGQLLPVLNLSCVGDLGELLSQVIDRNT